MELERELERLRTEHGDAGVQAYEAIGKVLNDETSLIVAMFKLFRVIERHGQEATQAAFDLYYKRPRSLADRLREAPSVEAVLKAEQAHEKK